eukprot:1349704-Amorphochlora_amoeboformis.AAC.1
MIRDTVPKVVTRGRPFDLRDSGNLLHNNISFVGERAVREGSAVSMMCVCVFVLGSDLDGEISNSKLEASPQNLGEESNQPAQTKGALPNDCRGDGVDGEKVENRREIHSEHGIVTRPVRSIHNRRFQTDRLLDDWGPTVKSVRSGFQVRVRVRVRVTCEGDM